MAERDFQNYRLADLVSGAETVYTLAGGVIPEIAERLDFALDDEPNSQNLYGLVGALGKNKVLRDNKEVTAIDRETAVGIAETAGVQKSLHRSLWTPDISAYDLDAAVLTGAVVNWQRRGVIIVQNQVNPSVPVIVATGNRVMDTQTEVDDTIISSFFAVEDRYPTETEFARDFVVPRLQVIRRHVRFSDEPHVYDTKDGGEIAAELFRTNPELLGQKVGFARVANAGIQMAVQMRAAAREIYPDFDADEANPQAFVLTDSFPLATTAEEEAKPKEYQKAIPALRQTVLTAKVLHEAAGGE